MSRFGIFKIKDVPYDLDDLEIDEVEEIEELSGGTPFGELNYASGKTMHVLAFVLMKRNQPDISYEEVGKVKILDFLPADEEMPALPPEVDDEVNQNGSELDGSGAQASVVSITG